MVSVWRARLCVCLRPAAACGTSARGQASRDRSGICPACYCHCLRFGTLNVRPHCPAARSQLTGRRSLGPCVRASACGRKELLKLLGPSRQVPDLAPRLDAAPACHTHLAHRAPDPHPKHLPAPAPHLSRPFVMSPARPPRPLLVATTTVAATRRRLRPFYPGDRGAHL
jgi:hypothetical protein